MKLGEYTDRELTDLQTAILKEQAIRRKLDASPEKIERAIAEYQVASGKGQGEPWEQPTGPMDAYRRGAIVEHEGRIWVSTHGNNVHSPGQSGWRFKPELDEDGNEIPPEYVAPSGAHDAYQQGERVTFDGEVWEAVRDGVVHSPAEYPADWSHIIPATPIEPIEPEPEPEPEPEEPPEEGEEPDEPEPEPKPEPEEPALPEWKVGVDYQPGDAFIYQGVAYTVVQAHTSAGHWLPPDLPALYERQ